MATAVAVSSRNDAVTRFIAGDASSAAVQLIAEDSQIDGASDGLLDVGDLVRMFEESEESTYTARQEAERDRDYVDNKQLTAEQLSVLKNRGQPPQIDNRIKTKIDYLVGLEKQQRIDPKALPRTPLHEEDADGATQALRYVAETEDFDSKRSGVWRNMLVEGAGGIGVSVEPSKYGKPQMGMSDMMGSTAMSPPQEYDVKIRRYSWDRMFWDPHSSEADFSDAGYLGVVLWMDLSDASLMYPDAIDVLESTLSEAPSNTYDDKPKFSLWADKKRKRVRICQIWLKKDENWHFAEYTKGGILKSGPSPYVTDKGESDCELFFQSAYVDRDNNRYGLVREMVTLQDGINKRHSKALHILNTSQVWIDEDALPAEGIEHLRKESVRPDGAIVLAPGSMANGKVKIERNIELAQAQLGLLQDAKNSIDLKGPNATQMGDKAQGSSSASGKAIIASQQGGMISLGDLLDNLRHLDKRVFRAVWARVRQYWTTEKWIRVTDDERNLKWVGMNVDPQKMQMLQAEAQQNPQIAEKIGGIIASIAELDCDIIIDEVPDVLQSQEQFDALVQLKQFDVNNELPFRAIVAASRIKDKTKMLDEMDKAKSPPPGADVAQQLQMAGVKAKVDETVASAGLKDAQRQKTLIEAQLAPVQAEHEANMNEAGLMQRQVSHEQGLAHQAQTHQQGLEQKSKSDQMRAAMQAQRTSVPSVRSAA